MKRKYEVLIAVVSSIAISSAVIVPVTIAIVSSVKKQNNKEPIIYPVRPEKLFVPVRDKIEEVYEPSVIAETIVSEGDFDIMKTNFERNFELASSAVFSLSSIFLIFLGLRDAKQTSEVVFSLKDDIFEVMTEFTYSFKFRWFDLNVGYRTFVETKLIEESSYTDDGEKRFHQKISDFDLVDIETNYPEKVYSYKQFNKEELDQFLNFLKQIPPSKLLKNLQHN
ncbi:MAG: hypothetical protein ACRC4L_00330 [Mycoplasma sp.]